MDIKKAIEGLTVDADQIADPAIKTIVSQLLNIIECLVAANNELKEENQKLRDEVNRLKGEQGKPSIRKQSLSNQDVSSETERRKKKKKQHNKSKNKKKNKISI